MTSDEAQLIGVVSPTGQSDGFCVPVFSDPARSNHLLVQIVDENNRIVAFEPLFDLHNLIVIDAKVSKKVGEAAFWYFKLQDDFLCGEIDDMRAAFSSRKVALEANPYVFLQVVTACSLSEHEAEAIRAVRFSLQKDINQISASAWLDTSVLSPKLRRQLLQSSSKIRDSAELAALSAEIIAVTDRERTTVFVPEALRGKVGEAVWANLEQQFSSILADFDLKLSAFAFSDVVVSEIFRSVDVSQLKRDAVLAFSQSKEIQLRRATKSYFEDTAGAFRAVCTFSSRYENKGKRKYWYGFHETWNQWLEGAKDAYLLLGCIDARVCFAIPLSFIRAQLPNLRTTGTGKDKYWHIDIVDIADRKYLLDVPRRRTAVPLSEFMFSF